MDTADDILLAVTEKLYELLITPINCILGLILDLHCMTVGMLSELIAATVTLL